MLRALVAQPWALMQSMGNDSSVVLAISSSIWSRYGATRGGVSAEKWMIAARLRWNEFGGVVVRHPPISSLRATIGAGYGNYRRRL